MPDFAVAAACLYALTWILYMLASSASERAEPDAGRDPGDVFDDVIDALDEFMDTGEVLAAFVPGDPEASAAAVDDVLDRSGVRPALRGRMRAAITGRP